MVTSFLETPIEFLKGVGPARAEMLKKELQIFSFGELLSFFPFRYVDRSKIYKISEIKDDSSYYQVKGTITRISSTGSHRFKRLSATISDESGEIELIWFQGVNWVSGLLSMGKEFIVFGKPTLFNGRLNFAHPELESPADQPSALSNAIRPLYSSTENLKAKGLDSRGISKLVKTLLLSEKFSIPENLTGEILANLRLMGRQEAFINIHFPSDHNTLKKAQARLKFEELFYIQLRLLQQKFIRTHKSEGHIFSVVGDNLNNFYHHYLSFELTNAQKRVIKEIRSDLKSGQQMNRLLQGDVGSGKTLVALMIMLIALDNGFQTCLMAPTEILANQHFQTISGMLDGLGIKMALLTGSTKQAERKKLFSELLEGSMQILIGTHALIEEKVLFRHLGLVVIDEQHRFGVEQRAKLWDKNIITPRSGER